MLLKSLKIFNNNSLIREVIFKKGLNFITAKKDKTDSDNNLGKTTALRVVDYLLGSKGIDIYTDSETKGVNWSVKNFLYDNEILCELIIENNGQSYVLIRNFAKRKKIILSINGNHFKTIKEYNKELLNIIFSQQSESPSFRDMIQFFIRSKGYQNGQLLHLNYQGTSKSKLKLIHTSLFSNEDISNLSKETFLIKKKKEIVSHMKDIKIRYNFDVSISNDKILSELESQISLKEEEFDHIKKEKGLHEEIEKNIRKIKHNIQEKKIELESLYHKKDKKVFDIKTFNNELDQINNNLSKIEEYDGEIVESLYKSAQVYFSSDLYDKFDKKISIEKHNHQIYLNDSVIIISKRKDELLVIENEILKVEKEITVLKNKLYNEDTVTYHTVSDIKDIAEFIGELKEKLSLLNKYNSELKNIEDTISKFSGNKDLEDNINILNTYYSKYQKNTVLKNKQKTLPIRLLLGDDNSINISDMMNDGPGVKNANSILLAMSYLSMAIEVGISLPHFFLFDGIEHVEKYKNMKEVFNLITKEFGLDEDKCGQFIFPILPEKLEGFSNSFDNDVVLSLTDDEKFFKIP